MNRITSLLALSALVIAGAFAGTAAQASASNVNVDFNVVNGDASASMIRIGQSSGISGLITPAAAILPGNTDPASGSGLFSAPIPVLTGSYVEGWVRYANASNTSLNICTFNMRVTRLGSASFKLHGWVSENGTNCTAAPAVDVTNSDGQFTTTIYGFTWKT
jgi:hypothetical protein